MPRGRKLAVMEEGERGREKAGEGGRDNAEVRRTGRVVLAEKKKVWEVGAWNRKAGETGKKLMLARTSPGDDEWLKLPWRLPKLLCHGLEDLLPLVSSRCRHEYVAGEG